MIKAIVFDLWNTLIYRKNNGAEIDKEFAEILEVNEKDWKELRDEYLLVEEYDSIEDIAIFACTKLKVNGGNKRDKLVEHTKKSLEDVKIYEDTLPTLEYLKRMGIKVGLLSNTSTPFKKPFYDLDLKKYFNYAVLSCEVGLAKPDKDIYRFILKKLDVHFMDALMIGDSLKDDYEGALNVGLDALLLDRKNKISHIEIGKIKSLDEIRHLI